ncbi:MAG: hypothetical protein ACYS7Y_32840 [Planctomycetota bacterium]|jgi:hypothetical protein
MKRLTILILLASVALLGAARDVRDTSKKTAGVHFPDYTMSVAIGAIPGAFTVNKFGYNSALTSSATEESVWDAPDLGGPVRCFTVLGTTPATLYLSSSAAGDATESVTIEGLTTDYVAQTATVALGAAAVTSGTVPAAAGTWLRVNRMYATSTALTGDIYLANDNTDADTNGVPDAPLTTIVSVIDAGENQTLQACYTVPAGFTAVQTDGCISNLGTGTPAVTFRFRTSVEGAASRTKTKLSVADELSICNSVTPPRVFTEKTDIEVTGAATTQAAGATFGLIVIPNGEY